MLTWRELLSCSFPLRVRARFEERCAGCSKSACSAGARPIRSHRVKPDAHSQRAPFPLQEARNAYERDFILKKVDECHGNMSRAAEALGLDRTHLYRKMKALGISARE